MGSGVPGPGCTGRELTTIISGVKGLVFAPRSLITALVALFVAAVVVASAPAALAADIIHSFDAVYRVQADGNIDVTETIVYDFGSAQRHGIFRNLVDRQDCPSDEGQDADPDLRRVYPCTKGYQRQYEISMVGVTDEAGTPYRYTVERHGDGQQIKIGDPDRAISGQHTYVIRYRLGGTLDAYPQHDELYWNATGSEWEAPLEQATVRVELPSDGVLDATCFQGASRSTAACDFDQAANAATYTATRELRAGEQLTVVLGWERGMVTVAPPVLKDKPSIDDFFKLDIFEIGGALVVAMGSLFGVIALWWRNGRDKAYRSLYYLTNDPTQGTKPMFSKENVVVEFLPPDGLRPAQMGVILDERADTLDVTATIIDLAIRGHLHITEIPKKGLFGKKDWRLDRLENPDPLLPYEQLLWASLFEDGASVEISDLKNTFYEDLAKVKNALYDDAMEKKWFTQRPGTSMAVWMGAGFGIAVLGAILAVGGAIVLGRGLIFAPVILAGLVMVFLSPSMKRRTAKGSEALRRVLGFRLYVVTAEKRIQEFNEDQNILNNFAKYLPFAMVFGAVEKWAKALDAIGSEAVQNSTANWYTGVGAFSIASFSNDLQGFSSTVGTSISSSPSSSGSGFSGGSAGGGGGSGGGGSW